MVPKWTPEASGNVCGRRSATERAKNASWRPPGREKIGKKVFQSSTNRLSSYGADPAWGWRAYFRRPGPLGTASRARSRKEIYTTRPLHRILHASGQRPGEFLTSARRLRRPLLYIIFGACGGFFFLLFSPPSPDPPGGGGSPPNSPALWAEACKILCKGLVVFFFLSRPRARGRPRGPGRQK